MRSSSTANSHRAHNRRHSCLPPAALSRVSTVASLILPNLSMAGFDLAQFDPVAADLDLVVDPAQVLDVALGEKAGQVAGPVQDFARLEGIGDKFGRCQALVVQIAAADAARR